MAVLSKDAVLKAIEEKKIEIIPYNPENLGPASYDLKLGNEFRTFIKHDKPIDVTNEIDYKDITELQIVEDGKPFILGPNQICLGITKECLKLSGEYCGLLEGRSRFARLGLAIHITASFMQPGVQNRQVLEIFNCSTNSLALYPGTKICQFIFMKMEGEAVYKGALL
ncbi:dCTP deaminase [Acrasis kona]|uniref:dCTP deaminase n=1 Tax=Acrasis kona TaxID=1008807 RepID=A0AAW2Z998_9EUKA